MLYKYHINQLATIIPSGLIYPKGCKGRCISLFIISIFLFFPYKILVMVLALVSLNPKS